MRCGLFRSYVAVGFAVVAAAGAVGGGGWPASAGLVGVPARVGAAPVTAAMPTLTVRGIDAAGHPDTGDGVVVANVDNPNAFGNSQNAFGAFHDGIATFRVPAGTYWAVGVYNTGTAWGGPARPAPAASATAPMAAGAHNAGTEWSAAARPARAHSGAAQMVVLPQFTVSGNTTITVDARTATSRVRLTTPLPAAPKVEQINVERISHKGKAFAIDAYSLGSPGGFYVTPISHAPADGTLESSTAAQLFSPASAPAPYQYYIVIKAPRGTIPPQNVRVRASSLATVHENLYAGAAGTGDIWATGFLPSELGLSFDSAYLPRLHVPGRDTMYLSAVGGAQVWQAEYDQVFSFPPGGQTGAFVTYRPGQVVTENWNAYPLHTAPNVNLIGAANPPNLDSDIVSANRSADTLTLDFSPFTDNTRGHLGTGYVPVQNGTASGSYQIRQNGKTIASGNPLNSNEDFYTQVTLSPKPSVISFTLTAKRTGPPFTLSTATSTTWTWRSAHESGTTVPKYWYCSLAANHNCAPQPLPTLSYAVGGLALNGTTAPGAQSLTVTVGHLQLAAAQTVTKVTVQASVNDGKTWTSAAVTGSAGTYRARYTAPPSRHVTLRVTATTATGSQISETITRAYATAP